MELIIISIALILGIIWGLYFKISVVFFLPCLLCVAIFVKNKYRRYLLIFLITILVSNIYISIFENSFDNKYRGVKGDVTIIGTIVSEPKIKKYSTQFIVKVEEINNDSSYENTKILLNVNMSSNNLKYGNKVKIFGKLEDAETARNEGGFDYKQYLKTKGIYKIMSVKKEQINIIKENNIGFADSCFQFIRNSINDSIKKLLPDKEANFLIAILIGDKQELDEEIQDDFRNSSLSHIIAVSGMHVSFIIMGITFILKKLKIEKNKCKIFLIFFLILFIFLTGGSPSVQRACIMAIYLIIGKLLHRRTNILNSIAFSALIVLIINPYSLLDVGFQLSFGGTIGIVIIYPKLKKKLNLKSRIVEKIVDILFITLSANVVIFPIILYHYKTISTIFLFSNLIASLIIGIIYILGVILTGISYVLFPLSELLAILEKVLIDFLLQIANLIGNIPYSQIYFVTPNLFIITLYYLFIFIFFSLKGKTKLIKKIKIFIIVLLVISILSNFIITNVIQNDLRIYFIDVGQR